MTDTPAPVDEPIRDSMTLTVTLFGHHDAIDQAISDELGRRGGRTHSVSVQTGWLASTSVAIVRLDTAAGTSAFEGLRAASGPGIQVIATCEQTFDPQVSERVRHLCEKLGSTHAVTLIWHGPLAPTIQSEAGTVDPPVRDLALVVVDEVADQSQRATLTPSFSTRSIAV